MKLSLRNILWSILLTALLGPGLLAAQEPKPGSDQPASADEGMVEVASADFAALQQALQSIAERRTAGERQPIKLVLPSGHYSLSETLHIEPSLVGDGLRLQAAEPGNVIFSGGIALSLIGRDDASNWRYRLPAGWDDAGVPRMLVVNGQSRSAARHPNEGYFRIEAAMEDRRSGFTAKPGDIPETLDVTATTCDLVLLHDWSSSRLPVASYEAATRHLRTVGPIGCEAPHYAIDHFEKQPRYWLEGHPAFADRPLEWYIDADRNALVVVAETSSGDDARAPDVVLPVLTSLLTASGSSEQPLNGFVLDGITFSATRFPMPPGGLAGAQATMHEARDADGKKSVAGRPFLSAAVHIDLASECMVQGCRFESLGNSGLWIGRQTTGCEVKQCRFQDVGGNGINLGEDNQRRVGETTWYRAAPQQVPSDNRVLDCEISRCGQMLPGAVAIWAGLHQRLEVANNHIHNCPYTGISLGWIWNDSPSPARENNLHHNHIESVMQVLSDGGGIYTLGRQPGTALHHNRITDVPLNAGRAESNGMFLDEGSTGLTIHHNTFRRLEKSPLRFHKAGKNVVRDNRWELASETTPPVRFNNTPEENIQITSNTVLEPSASLPEGE